MAWIQVQAVSSNPKCGSCLHYDPQRSESGVCMVALRPWLCGDGETPDTGYHPLVASGAHMPAPMAPSAQVYGVAPANAPVSMKLQVLGEEHAQMVKSLVGELLRREQRQCALHQDRLQRSGMTSLALAYDDRRCTCASIRDTQVAKAMVGQLSNRVRASLAAVDLVSFVHGIRKGLSVDEWFSKAMMPPKPVMTRSQPQADMAKSGGEGSHGGRIIGHTKSGKPIYGPTSNHIARVREHVNLQKRTATSKLQEHAHHHVRGPSAKGYSPDDHKDAAEAHHREAASFGNSDKVRAFHKEIAHTHQALSEGKLSPADEHQAKTAAAAVKREAGAKKKEAARKMSVVGVTEGGHQIKNTHHIRATGFGPELHSGPGLSHKISQHADAPIETELGDHLSHDQHKDIADWHREQVATHAQTARQFGPREKHSPYEGSTDFTRARKARIKVEQHTHAASLHDAEAAKKSPQAIAEVAGQQKLF
jgi:hypothetical protein